MRLVVDVSLSPAWIPILTAAGHDAVHWGSQGAINAPDTVIMALAKAENRAVFTHDLDFTTILASTRADGPSVVQLREQDVDPDRVGSAVLKAIEECEPGAHGRCNCERDFAAIPCPHTAFVSRERR